MQGPHWIIVMKCCHYNGVVFNFIYLTMTYILLLKEAPSPEGMCLFNQLQHFFRVQQGWMEWPYVSSDNTEAPWMSGKNPPASNNGRQYLQSELMSTCFSRGHWDRWKSLHMPPVSLASCFTLLDKGLSPGETAVKTRFEEEDKFRKWLWDTQQAQLISTGKEPVSH